MFNMRDLYIPLGKNRRIRALSPLWFVTVTIMGLAFYAGLCLIWGVTL